MITLNLNKENDCRDVGHIFLMVLNFVNFNFVNPPPFAKIKNVKIPKTMGLAHTTETFCKK